jgi:hypothetical protein
MRYSFMAGALVLALSPATATAAEKAEIDEAISRGLAALQKLQTPDGSWSYAALQARAGATALAGLTLLECGVAKDNPQVVSATQYLRKESITLRHTYSTSLALIFFDRLGDPADKPLIESLAARLVTGQKENGAWSYWLPEPLPIEQRRLMTAVSGQKAEEEPARAGKTSSATAEFRQRVLLLNRQAPDLGPGVLARADNSNTQFACLALWVARRHNLPVDASLRIAAAHFRTTQNPVDFGWSYEIVNPGETRATMTCAGILGLAVGWGVRNEKQLEKGNEATSLSQDKQLQRALARLSMAIGAPLERIAPATPGAGPGGPGGLGAGGFPAGRRILGAPVGGGDATAGGKAYYFLWSLERVAVALNLSTVNKKDWYGWGSDVLLSTQQPNGLWQGEYAEGGVDTCFALLFLKKANFADDLSKLTGHVEDGQTQQLKVGGVGGNALAGPRGEESPKSAAKQGNPAPQGAPSRPALPTAERPASLGDTPGAKLAEKLLEMSPEGQAIEIRHLRDERGADNTEALATAIPYMASRANHDDARKALADRLARMSAKTLGSYLQDELPEIRRAAALACGEKNAKEFIPQLIALLSDQQPIVARAAYSSLKRLSGEDFGPARGADDEAVKRASAEWLAWWKKQSR